MIFDRLAQARRRRRKELNRLDKIFSPLIAEAQKQGDQEKVDSLFAELFMNQDLIDEPVFLLETRTLLNRADELEVPFSRDVSNALWERGAKGYRLSVEGKAQLRGLIRKEENERLEHRMRWISRVVLPLIALLGTVIGTIGAVISYLSLAHHWSQH